MRRAHDLEQRLVEWGREYGGGKYDEIGWHGMSQLLTLMTYHGPAPQGLNPKTANDFTPSDQVEVAVSLLQRQRSGFAPAQVLRIEYTKPGQSVDGKIPQLRRIGVHVSDRARYSQLLHIGRVHVGAAIGLPFSDFLYAESAA